MNYLFLDLSSTSSGWCVADDKGKLLDYGCITSSSTLVLKRLEVMKDNVQKIARQYNIKKAIAEEIPGLYNNNRTYKILSWVQGVVMLALYEVNPVIQLEFMQSSQWRSKIGIKTGRGIKRETLKKADIQYVKDTYGIDANDDICDSICLKDAYFSSIGEYDWSE